MSDRKNEYCQAPDRHEPRIKCGCPLPCPHHSVVVEVGRIDDKFDLDNFVRESAESFELPEFLRAPGADITNADADRIAKGLAEAVTKRNAERKR